jgi:hypothetical protein
MVTGIGALLVFAGSAAAALSRVRGAERARQARMFALLSVAGVLMSWYVLPSLL